MESMIENVKDLEIYQNKVHNFLFLNYVDRLFEKSCELFGRQGGQMDSGFTKIG